LSDFHLFGGPITPLGNGHPIAVGWMKGRSRAYEILGSANNAKSALSSAFSDACDAVVASAIINDAGPLDFEPKVIAFLNDRALLHWVKLTLGL
jgi:hypothetical protein